MSRDEETVSSAIPTSPGGMSTSIEGMSRNEETVSRAIWDEETVLRAILLIPEAKLLQVDPRDDDASVCGAASRARTTCSNGRRPDEHLYQTCC